MREIVNMQAGSHLYGTSVPESDQDHQLVYIPAARSILLQQSQGGTLSSFGDKLDVRTFALHKYIKLLLEGQPIALDMLFTPEKFYLRTPEPEWYAILENREKFLSKRAAPFVSYCQSQVSKYSLKAERYSATSAMVALLDRLCLEKGGIRSLGNFMDSLEKEVEIHEYVSINEIEVANGISIPHLEVAGTQVPLTASLKTGLDIFQNKLSKYGERVHASKNMGNKDWKSMMHAVRVAQEAVELLETGGITFPRPEASLLLAIRLGKIPYARVYEVIEEGLVKVEEALKESKLPENPNQKFAESMLEDFYRAAVVQGARTSDS